MRTKDLHRVRKNRWYVSFYVNATLLTNNEFYFDRWRIYANTKGMRVAAFNDTASRVTGDNKGRYIVESDVNSEMIGTSKLFSSTGAFEHDFILDVSTRTTPTIIIAISGFDIQNDMTQVYASPTGFSATRNKNAQIQKCFLRQINPTNFLRLDNQSNLTIGGDLFPSSSAIQIKALNVQVNNSGMVDWAVDNAIIYTDQGGKSNGYLNYSGNANPTVNSRAAYDSLISKGWTITGTAPPTS